MRATCGGASSRPGVGGHGEVLFRSAHAQVPDAREEIPAGTSLQEFLDELHKALMRHTEGRLTDDVAIFLIDRLG